VFGVVFLVYRRVDIVQALGLVELLVIDQRYLWADVRGTLVVVFESMSDLDSGNCDRSFQGRLHLIHSFVGAQVRKCCQYARYPLECAGDPQELSCF